MRKKSRGLSGEVSRLFGFITSGVIFSFLPLEVDDYQARRKINGFCNCFLPMKKISLRFYNLQISRTTFVDKKKKHVKRKPMGCQRS